MGWISPCQESRGQFESRIVMLIRVREGGIRWLSRAAGVMTLLAIPEALGAQSCPLCYQSAAAGGSQLIQALKNGVLVLFFPPLLILGAISYVAYRKRNQFNSTEEATRIEFEFDEPGSKSKAPRDAASENQKRANVADTIEL